MHLPNSSHIAPLLRAAALLPAFFVGYTTFAAKTVSQPRVLLYVPIHVSESTAAIIEFAQCTFDKAPSLRGLQFDVLLSMSGVQSDGREEKIRAVVAKTINLRSSRVSVSFTLLTNDSYGFNVPNDKRRGTQWVSGPNAAFYSAFLNGPVFYDHVQHYDLVHQLETDVCAMQPGWLDVLVQPMLTVDHILVSGAVTACDCVYDAVHDTCEPVGRLDDHIVRHVNGNALYRIGTELKAVLARAERQYGNTEPFDLAVYWTMKDMRLLRALFTNPRYVNMPCLVDRHRFALPFYHGTPDAVAVHAPRRLRTTNIQAVVSRAPNSQSQTNRKTHTLTVVALLDSAPQQVLANQRAALSTQIVDAVVYIVGTRTLFNKASKVAPLQVIAAFGDDANEKVVDPPSLEGGQKRYAATNKHAVPQRHLETWPDRLTPAACVLIAVARIVAQLGHDVFVMGPDAVPVTNYGGMLAGLPRHAVHVGDDGVLWFAYKSTKSVGMTYMPASKPVACALEAWASAVVTAGSLDLPVAPAALCTPSVSVHRLPSMLFVPDGGPLLQSGWPGRTLQQRAIVAVGGGSISSAHAIFRQRHAGLWPPTDTINCANYSALPLFNITGASVGQVAALHAEFAAFVAHNAIACAVAPGFGLPATRSRVDVTSVFDYNALVRLCGGARLVPSVRWIGRPTTQVPFRLGQQQHRRPRGVHAGRAAVSSFVPQHSILLGAVHAVVNVLGPRFVCVHDPQRSADELAVLLMDRNASATLDAWLDAVRSHYKIPLQHRLLLTGAWKAVSLRDVTNHAGTVYTLADVAAAVVGIDTRVAATRLFTPPLATKPQSPLLDAAWADVIEGLVCEQRAAGAVNAGRVFPSPLDMSTIVNRVLSHIPYSVLSRDLGTWRRKPGTLKLKRPPIVACVRAGSVVLQATLQRTLHTIADVQTDRAIALPHLPAGGAWPAAALGPPNVLPLTVMLLALPRLALLSDVVSPFTLDVDVQSAAVAVEFAAEVALAKRMATRWANSVLWEASGVNADGALGTVRATPFVDGVLFRF